ncbi:cle7, putative [Pediculus humanus corporis]|uniref:Cle7, putative n=1 Tax=Pediculus humanus subsp. corporis TaxID=121224 RepID=E0VJ29_PEDHC|nr:cle7, putative [Pediculus humanus corporis]EEB13385.1 cle7, putative [Pediculus humanus corporis]
MFKRKLLALDYPTPDKFDINSKMSLILWLEDQKIRHYKVDDRSKLRDLNSPDWNTAYTTYLNDIVCPIVSKKREEELGWLLSFAVRLEYNDDSLKYRKQISEILSQNQESAPKVVPVNSLDNMDFQSTEFINEVFMKISLLYIHLLLYFHFYFL